MQRNIWWLLFVLLLVYFGLAFCKDSKGDTGSLIFKLAKSAKNSLLENEESRTRRRHGLYHHLWGWHALAIAYWIKVKLVIVAFFVGTALFWGLRYIWPQKCASDVVHDSPIYFDHPHSFHDHHDHVPYVTDHTSIDLNDHTFDPYSAYIGSDSNMVSSSVVDLPTSTDIHRVGRRSTNENNFDTEEEIANFIFTFLGLDSKACRQRFICEMEFRSRHNSITNIAFRVIGRSFFEKYTNALNSNSTASSYNECAVVNSECVFIEQNELNNVGEQDI